MAGPFPLPALQRLQASVWLAIADYGAQVRRFSYNGRLFLAMAFLGGFAVGTTRVIFNLYVTALGYREDFVGTLLFAAMFAGGLAALPAGVVAGRVGTKRTLIGGSLLAALGVLAQVVTGEARLLLMGSALAGAGIAAVQVAQVPFLARHSTPAERTHLFSAWYAVFLVATIGGEVGGGWLPDALLDWWPGLPVVVARRWTLLLAGLVTSLAFPLLLLIREDSGARQGRGHPAPELVPGAQSPMPNAGAQYSVLSTRYLSRLILARQDVGPLARLAITDGLVALGSGLVVPYLNLFFVRHLGTTTTHFGVLSGAATTIRIAGTLAVPILAARAGPVGAIACTQLMSVVSLFTIGFAPTLAVAAGAFLFRSALMNMTVPVRDAFAMQIVRPESRPAVSAILLVVNSGLGAISSAAGGRAIRLLGYRLPFVATAGLYTLSGLAYLLFWGTGKAAVASQVEQAGPTDEDPEASRMAATRPQPARAAGD